MVLHAKGAFAFSHGLSFLKLSLHLMMVSFKYENSVPTWSNVTISLLSTATCVIPLVILCLALGLPG